jgi:hypothetical protein
MYTPTQVRGTPGVWCFIWEEIFVLVFYLLMCIDDMDGLRQHI